MGTFRSLRHRNYRLYFFGQMVSLVGSWMQSAAVTWLAYRLTDNQSKWPAFLAAAQMLPTVFLGPWSGALADRTHKLRLILRTQTAFLITAALLAALSFAGLVNEWVLLTLMLAQGIVQAIDLPARLAFVPDLVTRDDLINAIALNSVLFNVARTTGPALAGILLVFTSPAVCFLINAISYVAVLAALLCMKLPPNGSSAAVEPPSRSLLAGFAELRRQPRLLLLVLLAGFLAVCGWPLLALLPAYAHQVLGRAEEGYGTLLSAVGVGALLAGLAAATYGTEERRRLFLIGGACLVGLALTGLSLIARSQVSHLGLAALCCGAFGFGMILFFATGQAALQLSSTGANRGKLMGVWAMMLSGGAPLGNLLFGPAADAWSVRTVLLLQGLAVSFAAVALIVEHVGGVRPSVATPSKVP
jgi:MFS family permease